jgi:hypothetical protein
MTDFAPNITPELAYVLLLAVIAVFALLGLGTVLSKLDDLGDDE